LNDLILTDQELAAQQALHNFEKTSNKTVIVKTNCEDLLLCMKRGLITYSRQM